LKPGEITVDKHDSNEKTIFGFWVYLMTDLLMFAALFATYAVLRSNTFGGPAQRDIFNGLLVLAETIILLTSSFTTGLGMLALARQDKNKVVMWFGTTFILGLSFLVLEISEFWHLIVEGNSFQRSAFLSSFFTLVGTHGLHIVFGLVWMIILLIRVNSRGLTPGNIRKLTSLSLFWHFLDIVWIFIFTIVYLLGAAR
jgi:cytochrome o ubiquinol oxidase subunit 3